MSRPTSYRDSAGGTVWIENSRGKTDMVGIHWETGGKHGTARKQETRIHQRRFVDAVREK